MKLFKRFQDRETQRRLPRVLIGGMGTPNQADASAGVVAANRMADENWPNEITVMDIGEGGGRLAETLRQAAEPYDRIVLLASIHRGRAPGRIYSYRWSGRHLEGGEDTFEIDRLLSSLREDGVLPDEVILVELEPSDASASDALSDRALRLLPEMIRRAQREALASPKRLPGTSARSAAAS